MASVESPFKALAASAWLSTPPKRLSSGPLFWNTCRSPSTSTSLLNVHWLHTSYMLLHMSQLLITAIISCESVFKHIIHPSPTGTADSASSVGGDNNTTGWGREGEISFFFSSNLFITGCQPSTDYETRRAEHSCLIWNLLSLNGLQSWAIQENSESVYLHSRAPLHLQSRGMFWEGMKPCQSKRQPAGPPSGK